MKRAIVMNNVADAEHCVRSGFHKSALLFCTHSGLTTYMRELHGVSCDCLSKFVTDPEIRSLRNEASDIVDHTLGVLDAAMAPQLHGRLVPGMRYFTPLYSYYGKVHFLSYLSLAMTLSKMAQALDVSEISLYNRAFGGLLDTSTNMTDFVSGFCTCVKTSVLQVADGIRVRERGAGLSGPRAALLGFKRRAKSVLSRMAARLEFGRFSAARKTILLLQPEYDLQFLRRRFRGYNVLYYPQNSDFPLMFPPDGKNPDMALDFSSTTIERAASGPLARMLVKDIIEDFSKNAGRYTAALLHLGRIAAQWPISLGVWDVPPVTQTPALLFEYLMSTGVKVVGAQHGCIYGDSLEPWHFDSDFTRCTHYISYGFTTDDLRRLHPKHSSGVTILSFGAAKTIRKPRPHYGLDLLFPITNSISMLEGGMNRIAPDKLTERQVRLLEYLDSLGDFKVCVKPFPHATHENCSILPVLDRMKNIQVVTNVTLPRFLERHLPRSVLIEFPSQPLFDVLHLDTEIFLMNNEIQPFEEKALGELEKRVHYAEDVDVMIAKIKLFAEGRLQRKRDNTFYDHYAHKTDSRKNILRFLADLVDGGASMSSNC